MPLTIALPKGRLAEDALAFLKQAGYVAPANGDGSRKLILDGGDGRLRFVMVKPGDVPTLVEYGGPIWGSPGWTWCGKPTATFTSRYSSLRLLPAGRLRPGRARRPVAVAGAQPARRHQVPAADRSLFSPPRAGARTDRHVRLGELAPLVGLTDLIVDLVQTGATLRENGLVKLRTILESQAVLIANRASYRLRAGEVRELIDASANVIRDT